MEVLYECVGNVDSSKASIFDTANVKRKYLARLDEPMNKLGILNKRKYETCFFFFYNKLKKYCCSQAKMKNISFFFLLHWDEITFMHSYNICSTKSWINLILERSSHAKWSFNSWWASFIFPCRNFWLESIWKWNECPKISKYYMRLAENHSFIHLT